MRTVLVLLALLALTGCATSIDWNDQTAIASKIRTERDDYKQLVTYKGPNCARSPLDDMVVLRAWRDRDGITEYQLYIADEYTYEVVRGGSGWRFYSTAYDSDGNSLPATLISRNVNWCGKYVCSYLETVGLSIDRQYLEERKDRGINVKVSGKGGEEIFVVPPAYIRAFLATVS